MVKSSSQPLSTGIADAEHANPSAGGRNFRRSQTLKDTHRIQVLPVLGPDGTMPRFPAPSIEGE
jgi:hypothetical protein